MKKLLKNQNGAVIIAVILVIVLAVAGGGAAFLGVRMLVSGDGNFLQPFEELGWIESKEEDEEKEKSKKSNDEDDDEDEDEDDEEDKDEDKDDEEDDEEDDDDKEEEKEEKKSSKKTSGDQSKYLVDESRLSSEAKKSSVEHYYGDMNLANSMGGDADNEYADLYKLLKGGINIYAKDGKAVEIVFGFDISEFCKKAYEKYPEDFSTMGVSSASDLEDMMMGMIETMFDNLGDDTSDYLTKYVDGGSFQLYVTEKGFETLYETYNIEDGEDDVEILIDSLEEQFDTEIKLIK